MRRRVAQRLAASEGLDLELCYQRLGAGETERDILRACWAEQDRKRQNLLGMGLHGPALLRAATARALEAAQLYPQAAEVLGRATPGADIPALEAAEACLREGWPRATPAARVNALIHVEILLLVARMETSG